MTRQPKATEQGLSADFIRTEWDWGLINEEWFIGRSKAQQKNFEGLATVAARKLGCRASENASEHWLNRLLKWMRQEGLDKDKNMASLSTGSVTEYGSSGNTQGLFSEKIAELSAMFCLELIRNR